MNTKIKMHVWNRLLPDLLKILMMNGKSCSVGLTFGALEVISNHKFQNQKWTLDGKEFDPVNLTTEQCMEIYDRMEAHRLENIKDELEYIPSRKPVLNPYQLLNLTA